MDIVQYINNLLFDHDCVIVPGFGGFVANYQSAKIHPVQHNFSPPTKTILFNKDLKNNDGLLANQIVSSEKITYEEALEAVNTFALQNLAKMQNGEAVELEGIGKLYPDKEGNIQFEQTPKVNFLKDTFGMTSFVSPAIKRDFNRNRHQIRPNFADRQKAPGQKSDASMLLRIAASVAVVLILSIAGYNYFSPADQTVNESGILSSMDHFKNNDLTESSSLKTDLPADENAATALPENSENSTDILEPQKDEPVRFDDGIETSGTTTSSEYLVPETYGEEKPADAELSYNDASPEEITINSAETPDLEQVAATEIKPAQKMYYLIAGSFQEPENATSLIDEFREKGFEPMVIGPAENGFYRVSIMACVQKNDALAELRRVRETFNPNIWLLRN